MVLIPQGFFWMGSDNSWGDRMMEEYKNAWMPKHEVALEAFWIDKYPITNRLYEQFVKKKGHQEPLAYQRLEKLLSALPAGQQSSLPIEGLRTLTHPNHPVVGVTWHDAIAFCKWRSEREKGTYRLPTEAEWEKAARGGLTGANYPWGDSWNVSKCNTFERVESIPFILRAKEATTPVSAYLPNVYGLYDMYGNVEQWCIDYYDKTYYKNSSKENPHGPDKGDMRVIRGISYESYGESYRIEGRGMESPDEATLTCGFRCIREAD